MCYSATASFVSGSALCTAGAVTVVIAGRTRALPLAAIPLLFGAQQLAEGFVWLEMDSRSTPLTTVPVAMLIYMLFAYVVWPAYMPFASRLLETDPLRRRLLLWVQIIGAGMAAFLLSRIIVERATVHVEEHHLAYNIHLSYGWMLALVYFAVTTTSCLLSSNRAFQALGILTGIGGPLAYAAGRATSASVWCFFAALASTVIVAYLVMPKRHTRSPIPT